MDGDMAIPSVRQDSRTSRLARANRVARVAWAVATVFVVESLVLGLAVLPAVAFWAWHLRWTGVPGWARVVFLAMAFVPAYLLFAAGLMLYSAAVTRLLGWRTRPGLATRIADFEWPLLDWGRYLVTTHVVRLFAGAVFRSTPVWVMYLRLNGARAGRGVWVNSLALMDHNLLDLGDGAVVGSDAHVSGHIVEGGVLRTAPVRIGRGATIGIGSVVEIGADIGDRTQVGALSVVPKHARLDADAVYAGAPVRRIAPSGERRLIVTDRVPGLPDPR
jgi:acetyltransferase-like isoleucine patch superfamily enzyme